MLLLYIVFQVLQWPLIIPVKDMLEQMLASMDCCIYSWSIKCSKDKALFIKNTSVVNDFFFRVKSVVKSYDINGQLMKTASVVENRTVHVAALPKGICSRDCKW